MPGQCASGVCAALSAGVRFFIPPTENAPCVSPPSPAVNGALCVIGSTTVLAIKSTSAPVMFPCSCCRFSTGRERPGNNLQIAATRSWRVPDDTGAGPSAAMAREARKSAASFRWLQQKASHCPGRCALGTAARHIPAGHHFLTR